MAYGAQAGTALTMDKHVGRIGIVVRDTPLGALGYGRTFDEALTRGGPGSGGDEPQETSTDDEGDFVMDAPAELMNADYTQPFEGATHMPPPRVIGLARPRP